MNPWISAIVGAVAGYALLALTVLWMRNLCLPVSAHELKWQCDAGLWAIAAVYAGSTFVAVFLARRWKVAAGLTACAVLFLGHSLVPHLALVSFGKSWYLSAHTLLFAVIPAIVGIAAAILARRAAA